MGSKTGLRVGGLMSGIGAGIALRDKRQHDDTEQLRAEAVERAREIRQDLMRTTERNQDQEQRSAERADERQLHAVERSEDLKARETDRSETRKDRQLDRESAERIAGTRASGRSGSGEDDSGLSAGDKRLLDTVKERFTSADENGVTQTDWAAVDKELRRRGRTDLAGAEQDEGSAGDVSDPYLKEYASKSKEAADSFPRRRGASAPRAGSYSSAEDVGAAYKAGKIDRAEAQRILRDQFGYEE